MHGPQPDMKNPRKARNTRKLRSTTVYHRGGHPEIRYDTAHLTRQCCTLHTTAEPKKVVTLSSNPPHDGNEKSFDESPMRGSNPRH
jgi:hypothetical protein